MKVYNYHPVTKEFISETDADESPLEPGVFIIPGSATTVAAGTPADGSKRVFSTGTQLWSDVEDHRGVDIYATATGASQKVQDLGPVPAGFTLLVPGENTSWNGSAWAFDSAKALVKIRAQRNGKLMASDFTQLPDVLLTVEQKAAWATYRQELRDFPETCNPASPVWPTEPA